MQDLARAWKAAEGIDYGMIGVNETSIGSEVAPFGGLKHSGLGKELSKYGIEEFLSMKYLCFNVGYNKDLWKLPPGQRALLKSLWRLQ